MKKPLNCLQLLAVTLFCATASVASSAQAFTLLADFVGPNGASPQHTSLTQGVDGSLYGVTGGGGANAMGTVFRINQAGAMTTIHSFTGADGNGPLGYLALATDGNLYGVTSAGGANNLGTVFKITPGGTLTTLHSFAGAPADGTSPEGGLVQAADGNFYGTTHEGGSDVTDCRTGCGTVFKMSAAGALTLLHSFDDADGEFPASVLIQGNDGSFYGTVTFGGGTNSDGTIFKITPGGRFTTLHTFAGFDGANPLSGLVQATDGNYYGTTGSGGANDHGTVFRMAPDGTFTTFYSFCQNCGDGNVPSAGLIQATDGNFYGTTFSGGATGVGTVFQITSAGVLTTMHSFDELDGGDPSTALLQATNGKLYGTTWRFGSVNDGTLFGLSIGLDPFISFVRNPAKAGQLFGILGDGLSGATQVMLNGISATFVIKSDTLIVATVPPGAATGFVTVTTPARTLKSNVPFHVIE